MALQFVDPRGESAIEPHAYDRSVALDSKTTVGLLANGFPDSVAFLRAVRDAIAALRPDVGFVCYDKGDASAAAADDMLSEIKGACSAVITAYGH
jgi:hypothetical protein